MYLDLFPHFLFFGYSSSRLVTDHTLHCYLVLSSESVLRVDKMQRQQRRKQRKSVSEGSNVTRRRVVADKRRAHRDCGGGRQIESSTSQGYATAQRGVQEIAHSDGNPLDHCASFLWILDDERECTVVYVFIRRLQ